MKTRTKSLPKRLLKPKFIECKPVNECERCWDEFGSRSCLRPAHKGWSADEVKRLSDVLRKGSSRDEAIAAVRTLISYIGDDPDRPGLAKTPLRVIRAWEKDWGIGYDKRYIQGQVLSILGAEFDDGAENYNQMIAVKNIRFTSHCEHHMAEFSGTVDIAYIPNASKPKILGLSKFVRIVDMFSRRLQVQERLTNQIADFLQLHCKPQGVGVVGRATHSCMCSRGVRQTDPVAVTSALRGDMISDPAVRDEFLRLVGR